jgi:hypothetical protein
VCHVQFPNTGYYFFQLTVIATLKVEATITIRMVTSNVIILATTVMEGDISVVIVVAVVAFPGVLTVEVSVLVLDL